MNEITYKIKNFTTKHFVKIIIIVAVVLALFTLLGNNLDNKSIRTMGESAGSYGVNANYDYDDASYSDEVERAAPQASYSKNTITTAGLAVYDNGEDGGYIMPTPQEEASYDQNAERKLVRTGSVSMVVKSIDNARSEIQVVAEGFGGFVANSNFNQNGRYNDGYTEEVLSKSGSMSIKVPVDKFEKTMQALRDMALTVRNEYSSVQDVTERYSDLETQIENKEAEEKQYRALLVRASKISDVLEITRYVNQTRNEIERMQGQLNLLSNQTTLANISVYLESEQAYEAYGVTWDPIKELKNSWHNLLGQLVNVVYSTIAFIFWIPVLALYVVGYGIAILLVWKAGSWVFRKYISKHTNVYTK